MDIQILFETGSRYSNLWEKCSIWLANIVHGLEKTLGLTREGTWVY